MLTWNEGIIKDSKRWHNEFVLLGSVAGIYRTEVYRRHKLFFSTLKEYSTIMTKWTGCARPENKRALRSEAAHKEQPANLATVVAAVTALKKRTTKSKDAKSKPKEVSDAERAARDKAAIDRAKSRLKKRRVSGVKHVFVLRKLTKIHDNRLIGFTTNIGRFVTLPNHDLIEEATKLRVPVPKPGLFTMRQRPQPIPPIDDELMETHFRFVTGLEETPPVAFIPTSLLVAHHSTHKIPSPLVTAERASSAKATMEKASR